MLQSGDTDFIQQRASVVYIIAQWDHITNNVGGTKSVAPKILKMTHSKASHCWHRYTNDTDVQMGSCPVKTEVPCRCHREKAYSYISYVVSTHLLQS